MNIALAIEAHHKPSEDMKPNLISSFGTVVKELCRLFIRVIDCKIYLVHQTAKGYLICGSKTNDLGPGTWKLALSHVQSNNVLHTICVHYLLFPDFEV